MKLLDTAEIKDVQSVVTNGNVLNIRVNFYQRPYKWTAKKVTDLFDDYKENRLMNGNGVGSQEYFLGAVVLVDERTDDEKNGGKVWKYQVVDGQQRFTTLFLFNYIKYNLLVRKVDMAAKTNRSTGFIEGLKAMENCYKGFVGANNGIIIERANDELSSAFDDANRNFKPIEDSALNIWRKKVGWISNPDISSEQYYFDCKTAMANFLKDESLNIHYENNHFNLCLKEALTQIVFKFSDSSDVAFCIEPIEDFDYDEYDDSGIECPYVLRAYGIFEQVKRMYSELYPEKVNSSNSYDKLCDYIKIIDEMLENIKLCMIVTSDEDDAYKLFETLNDRSESVNDLELLKNYFFKTYVDTSGEKTQQIYNNISQLDSKWREVFFKFEELESEIFEYMTVFFTGNTSKNTNERKRKEIKKYLSEYSNTGIRYTYDKITRDFLYMEYIQKILSRIHRIDNNTMRINKEDSQMSLFIENDASSSIVKRALGLAMNLPYPIVVASIICDVLHNFASNSSQNNSDFDLYLNDVFNENICKQKYPGLWKDACVMWKVTILSKNYESPKKFSDKLAEKCNIGKIANSRINTHQLIQFNPNYIDEAMMVKEFEEWINEWKFSDGYGKLKIKNLFMHLFLKYDRYDTNTDKLIINQTIGRHYASDAIKQDLDHMDAKNVDRKNGNEKKYFHYNLSDRTDYTNSLGNMMPLPVAINRGKHNTPMYATIDSYPSENLVGWIFDMAKEEFDNNNKFEDGYKKPTEQFFQNRKDRLIEYFKKIVINQKFTPDNII